MADPLWQLLQVEAAVDERLYSAARFRIGRSAPPLDHEGRMRHAQRVLQCVRHRATLADGAACEVIDAGLVPEVPRSGVLLAHDDDVPAALAELDGPPCIGLWLAGDAGLVRSGRVRVGIVGSRRARAESLAIARSLASTVVRAGGVVVSGLATGVDGEAHRGALDAGGQTIGVLASGLQRIHPRRHEGIVARMLSGAHCGAPARGLLVSEYGPGDAEPRAYRFRERNRIIAALSDYLVVVQAHARSGSMNTASEAANLNVPVGAVASAVGDRDYVGSVQLLEEGADCIVNGPSLIRLLAAHGLARVDPGAAIPAHPLASLLTVPRSLEDVAHLAGLDLVDARRLLVELELDGHVERSSDGLWIEASRSRASAR